MHFQCSMFFNVFSIVTNCFSSLFNTLSMLFNTLSMLFNACSILLADLDFICALQCFVNAYSLPVCFWGEGELGDWRPFGFAPTPAPPQSERQGQLGIHCQRPKSCHPQPFHKPPMLGRWRTGYGRVPMLRLGSHTRVTRESALTRCTCMHQQKLVNALTVPQVIDQSTDCTNSSCQRYWLYQK